jgi:hypothetical protein
MCNHIRMCIATIRLLARNHLNKGVSHSPVFHFVTQTPLNIRHLPLNVLEHHMHFGGDSALEIFTPCDRCQNIPLVSYNDLIPRIRAVMSTPCITLSPPDFNFELTEDGAAHNLEVLRRYDFDLGKALKAQENSPLGNGKEFRPTKVLHSVFGLHPLWQRMKDFLKEGSIWLLAKLSEEERQNNIEDALALGNHKEA